MEAQLTAAFDELEGLLGALEPDCLDATFAIRLVGLFARGERLCAAGKTLAVGRVHSSGLWACAGDKSSAEWLARITGISLPEAIGVVETAKQLPELAATDAAVRAGQLSAAQTRTVVDAARVAPEAEQALLDSAARNGLTGLKDDALRAKAAAEDAAARTARHHHNRSVRTFTDGDGMSCGQWRLPAAVGADVAALLKTERDRRFHDARGAGEHENPVNYAADALVALITRPVGESDDSARAAAAQVNVDVRVDYEALLRGDTRDGEICEIAGIGPISVTRATEYLLGGAFLKLLITKGADVMTVCHYGRHIPAELRTAIEYRDQECAVASCHRRAGLEIHHIEGVAQGGPTKYSNLCTLCAHHHDQVTHRDYTLCDPNEHGKRKLVQPDTS